MFLPPPARAKPSSWGSAPVRRLLLLPLVLLATGCARGPRDPATVTILIESSPANLDPRIGTDAASERIDSLLFDALVRRDARFGIGPMLAASWEEPDPLTYVFHLRPGARFSNGALLTSRDVKYTLDSLLAGTVTTVKTASYRSVKAVEAPDPATVVLRLKQPDNALLGNLADGAFGVIPAGSPRDFWRHPVGSGPYSFVSEEQDKEVILRRNPAYWGGAPGLERLRFSVVPDAITRALELRKGSADVEVNALPTDLLPTLARDSRLRIQSAPGTTLLYLVLNLRDPLLRDPRVRRALAEAIDRPLVIRTLFDAHARPAASVLPPEHWAYSGEGNVAFDPVTANAELDRAGYRRGKDGTRFHIMLKTSTDESTRLLAAVLQAQFAGVGVALDIRSFEFATFYADMTRGSFQIASSRWIGGNESPDILSYAYTSFHTPPHGANRGFYSNARVDALLADAARNPDRAEQIRDYQDAQVQIARDLPVLNLWYLDTVAVSSRRLAPLALSPSGNYDFLRTAQLAAP